MKFLSYRRKSGEATYGAACDEKIIDLGGRFGAQFPTLRAFLASGKMDEVKSLIERGAFDDDLHEVEFSPVVPDAGKILCIGVNYVEHRNETGRSPSKYPTIFTRFPNSLVGNLQPLIRPRESEQFDYEGELAVIIGKGGRRIKEENALEHIAGYSCFNDGTLRDWQAHTTQFTPGKNFYASGAFGPFLVTSDEIPDPTQLTLTTRLNGAIMQQARTDELIFSIPQLIAYISTFTQLQTGDVISTGTPGGVGAKRQPPIFLKASDTIEVEITKIGTLRNEVAEE
jgi:2-keto-4-pentenoate hydratase/2-oxohepta-3-ene-1,7-dioic acid hydratase in catechol pathway